jgi:CRP-like cAMP-binding protein
VSATHNHLIDSLPRKDRARMMALCEPVQLVLGEILCEPGQPTRHVYFPIQGFVSLLASIDGKPGVEVGLVGGEGMVGSQLVLGVATVPLHGMVQGPGAALRITAAAFRVELGHGTALQQLLHRYIYVLMAQLASSATCLRFHQIGPRMARWVLMTQDRAHADNFHLTQEFLAHMLGVRRVGVTQAASALQRDGLIEYHHGHMTVTDRSGLEAAACSCYDADRRVYQTLLA